MNRGLLVLLLVTACARPAVPTKELPLVVFDCTTASFKPTTVIVACGDGGVVLRELRYSSWTMERAVGTATALVKLCEPDCATGKTRRYPVSVVYDKPVRSGDHQVLSRVVLTYSAETPYGDRSQTFDGLVELVAPQPTTSPTQR